MSPCFSSGHLHAPLPQVPCRLRHARRVVEQRPDHRRHVEINADAGVRTAGGGGGGGEEHIQRFRGMGLEERLKEMGVEDRDGGDNEFVL
ncbi:hypothetical protein L1987_24499 [Smallanthus sonchifolius]|uniref:Uncharacterized protein n=1 Tax=Smallanthus sonchifolius TaxID=185202 RepID=A0ACB9IM41_9ASTR|nr:hypothetical protein L1987_24499 [Smallanthus sonchifolius]